MCPRWQCLSITRFISFRFASFAGRCATLTYGAVVLRQTQIDAFERNLSLFFFSCYSTTFPLSHTRILFSLSYEMKHACGSAERAKRSLQAAARHSNAALLTTTTNNEMKIRNGKKKRSYDGKKCDRFVEMNLEKSIWKLELLTLQRPASRAA
jgi:hypothetical protein